MHHPHASRGCWQKVVALISAPPALHKAVFPSMISSLCLHLWNHFTKQKVSPKWQSLQSLTPIHKTLPPSSGLSSLRWETDGRYGSIIQRQNETRPKCKGGMQKASSFKAKDETSAVFSVYNHLWTHCKLQSRYWLWVVLSRKLPPNGANIPFNLQSMNNIADPSNNLSSQNMFKGEKTPLPRCRDSGGGVYCSLEKLSKGSRCLTSRSEVYHVGYIPYTLCGKCQF